MLTTVRNRTFVNSPFVAIDQLMSNLAREFAGGSCCAGVDAPGAMPIDIRERDNEYLVEASVPGFRKNEVDIQVHDGILRITAQREESAQDQGEGWIRRERSSRSLSRELRLPEGVTGDGIGADLADGVLTVHIPKPAQLQPRKIAVR